MTTADLVADFLGAFLVSAALAYVLAKGYRRVRRMRREQAIREEMRRDHARHTNLRKLAEWQREPSYYTRDLLDRRD